MRSLLPPTYSSKKLRICANLTTHPGRRIGWARAHPRLQQLRLPFSTIYNFDTILVANLVGKYAVIIHRLVNGHPVYTDHAEPDLPCTYSNCLFRLAWPLPVIGPSISSSGVHIVCL